MYACNRYKKRGSMLRKGFRVLEGGRGGEGRAGEGGKG